MSGFTVPQCAERISRRLSVPRRGHVLSTATEIYAGPLRTAVELLSIGLKGASALLPLHQSGLTETSQLIILRSRAEKAARHICAQWILGVSLGFLTEDSDLNEALIWFDTRNPLLAALHAIQPQTVKLVLENLAPVADPIAFADLLPYILDPHGPGSRLSVMRNPSTKVARAMRRAHGVFYTPADVAEHMAQSALDNIDLSPNTLRVFDPACGTGVFLRATLCTLHAQGADPLHIVQNCLFGMDIDPWSVDGAAYVLLHDAISLAPEVGVSPGSLWQSIRRNLAVGDALSLDPSRAPVRPRLFDLPHENARFCIADVFPAMGDAPNVIIGNPPYAAVSSRADFAELSAAFSTFPARYSLSADMHPLFFEQMVRLSAPEAAGALVLPLSVAFSTGQQYQAMRQLIEQTAGSWRFSFFDREPHALFGEDVKTRNSIITWNRNAFDRTSRKMTGPLLKWRGDDRARMLHGIRHTELHGSIVNGIPKLSGSLQSDALDRLTAQGASLSDLVRSFNSTTLERTFVGDRKTVFVGGTAYNFLNVFVRPPARLRPECGSMSTNTMHGLSCATIDEAFAALALLSSGVAFWLWHTLGDGFHVSRSFLEDFPLGPTLFNGVAFEELSSVGRSLWQSLQSCPVSSVNRGRSSLSFPASRLREQQREIDQIIIRASGLSTIFVNELDSFINSVVSAMPLSEADAYAPEEVFVG